MNTMFLRSIGSKIKIAGNIHNTFPIHDVYLEPFFRTGSVYFSKKKSVHNFLNDIDDDVFNLWNVYTHNYKELLEEIKSLPNSESLFRHWKKNKESQPVLKALRFLMLSNFAVFGSASFNLGCNHPKTILLEKYINSIGLMNDTIFTNKDFRKFYNEIKYTSFYKINNFTVMSYNDPPYLDTGENYSYPWSEKDTFDLFEINHSLSLKHPNKYFFAISEFNHPFILEQAKQRNLNIIELGERQNIKNRRTEILITNYETERSLFD